LIPLHLSIARGQAAIIRSARALHESTMSQTSHDRDTLTRFLLDGAGVRGVHVSLDATWQQIRGRAASSHEVTPLAAMELLGEAAAAAALFTGHAKLNGRLSIQLRGDGPLRTLFAECTAAGTLRGIAQIEEGAEVTRDLRALGPDALLAITIENAVLEGQEPTRYQGMVALTSDSLAEAFEDYFRQSEQLPTRLLLASDGERATGLMLQKLPGDGGDKDGWGRANALFDTLTTAELLALPGASLLHRLFHQEDAGVLGQRPVSFGCSCSRERVAAMLQSLGEDEAMAAAADGVAEIRCEFCGQQYHFDADQIAGLFQRHGLEMEAPDRLQ
jgi:molecular chaperone Hsp33